jgi:hypothetical protein
MATPIPEIHPQTPGKIPFRYPRGLAPWRAGPFWKGSAWREANSHARRPTPDQAKSYTITFTQTFLKTVSTNSTCIGWTW